MLPYIIMDLPIYCINNKTFTQLIKVGTNPNFFRVATIKGCLVESNAFSMSALQKEKFQLLIKTDKT